jgi:hypothetical protein
MDDYSQDTDEKQDAENTGNDPGDLSSLQKAHKWIKHKRKNYSQYQWAQEMLGNDQNVEQQNGKNQNVGQLDDTWILLSHRNLIYSLLKRVLKLIKKRLAILILFLR